MTELRCCGCGIVHPVEVLVVSNGLWLCFGCSIRNNKNTKS